MTHVVKLIPTNCYTRYSCALGGLTDKESILCEVTDGPYKGFRVAPSFLKSYTDLDAELEREAVALEEEAAHILANAKGMRELKGGNLILPTYGEFLEATVRAEREFIEAPLREAEDSLARLIAAGASKDKVAYAKINAAVYRKKLEQLDGGEDDYIDPYDNWTPIEWDEGEIDPGDGTGIPVRMEIQSAGLDEEGQPIIRFAIIDPINITLPLQRIDRGTLHKIANAVGLSRVRVPEELYFRPFTALIGDDTNVTTVFLPDDAPTVPVFEEGKKRPWGTVIGRLADREERRAAA